MIQPPLKDVPQSSATAAFDLLSDVADYLDHNDPRCSRVLLAMQLLNGDLTVTQALDRADALPRSS
jgi:hypothetical protein